jgi:hypothetical protein
LDILNPVRDIIETRFLGTSSKELAVTREDLIKLGLVTEQDLNQLDD